MARPWRMLYAGAKYHVTVRGNGRQTVFHEEQDYLRFIEQLSDAMEKDEVKLYAFVLMPNHFHLFIETKHGNIHRFMQRLNTSYSMYHRYKRRQPGHCFQGRYGAKLVKGDDYILRLTRYIHLNPVKVSACEEMRQVEKIKLLEAFKWSSYRGYIGLPTGLDLKVDERWLGIMKRRTEKGNRAAYRRYVESCVSQMDEEILSALEVSRYGVGEEEFIEELEDELEEVRINKGVYGDITWPDGRKAPMGEIMEAVAGEFGLAAADLAAKNSGEAGRKIAMELACRYSGLSQRQIGEHFGYRGNGSVLKQRKRLKEMLGKDGKLKIRMDRIAKGIANA